MKPVYWLVLGIVLIAGCTVVGVVGVLVEGVETTEEVKTTETDLTVTSLEEPEPTSTPKPTATPKPTFESMDDWSEEKCGGKNVVRDQIRSAVSISGLERHNHSDVKEGWVDPDKADRRHFPKAFRTPVRTVNKGDFGKRELGIMLNRYDYNCNYVTGNVTPAGYD
jgi:hypothetical protein